MQTKSCYGNSNISTLLNRVYLYLAGGIATSGIAAYFAAMAGMYSIMNTVTGAIGMVIALFSTMFMIMYNYKRWNIAFTITAFIWFAALFGIVLSGLVMKYTGTSIAYVFFITAGTFATCSIYGATTKRDLSSIGGFLMMGLIGILIASVVNIFIMSSMLTWALSVVGVLVFIGFTAYDTQQIIEDFRYDDDERYAVVAALTLYLDFLNLFIDLLQLLGVLSESND